MTWWERLFGRHETLTEELPGKQHVEWLAEEERQQLLELKERIARVEEKLNESQYQLTTRRHK